MNAIAMTVLLAVLLGGFAYSALRRIRLLMVGAPAAPFDHLFDRMATAPGARRPSIPGMALVVAIFALPVVGLALLIAGALPEHDAGVSTFVLFNAVGALATAGGLFLVWSMRAQMKMPKYPLAGIAHYAIFTGFAVLLLRTIILVGRAYQPGFNLWLLDPAGPLPWSLLGKSYNVMKDLVILGVIAGVLTFIRFRLLDHSKRLAYGWHAWVVLGVIATMMLADWLYDAGEMARHALSASAASNGTLTPADAANHHALANAELLGWVGGRAFLALGLTNDSALHFVAMVGYWTHVTLVWSFLNYLPYGKHFHVITALFNVFFRPMDPPGRLPMIAKNSEELMEKVGAATELANPTDAPIGVAQVEHFTWKQLLDFYTCTECGRCSDNCPAHRTGKLLSPKHFTIDLRNHLYERADEFLTRPGGPRGEGPGAQNAAEVTQEGTQTTEGDGGPSGQNDASGSEAAIASTKNGKPVIQRIDLVPSVIDPDVLWGCTTCRACEEQCPVMITYVDKIVDMRRNLVMVKGEFPHELNRTFQALETNGNPWNLTRMDRANWTDQLDFPVPKMGEGAADVDVLYWVGCAASYDDNAKKIARATARLLHAAGVKFAILGEEETCTGDPARRAGNELLYLMLAEQNVATLNGYAPKKIVTACPHCFNTLLNEYPDLGGKYEVVHHTDYLLGLLAEGRLRVTKGVRGKVAYHDSCYLGRYNDVYESPREILKRIPGLEVVEPSWSREKGLCCGAGGAQMWMEEQNNDRVNKRRTLQLLDTGADTIASACPFCHTMLTDGIKAFEGEPELGDRTVQQLDVAVILERACGLGAPKGSEATPSGEVAAAGSEAAASSGEAAASAEA